MINVDLHLEAKVLFDIFVEHFLFEVT